MATNTDSTPTKTQKEIFEEKYPVQQIAIEKNSKISEKQVEEAVKEINPDKNSLDNRG